MAGRRSPRSSEDSEAAKPQPLVRPSGWVTKGRPWRLRFRLSEKHSRAEAASFPRAWVESDLRPHAYQAPIKWAKSRLFSVLFTGRTHDLPYIPANMPGYAGIYRPNDGPKRPKNRSAGFSLRIHPTGEAAQESSRETTSPRARSSSWPTPRNLPRLPFLTRPVCLGLLLPPQGPGDPHRGLVPAGGTDYTVEYNIFR